VGSKTVLRQNFPVRNRILVNISKDKGQLWFLAQKHYQIGLTVIRSVFCVYFMVFEYNMLS